MAIFTSKKKKLSAANRLTELKKKHAAEINVIKWKFYRKGIISGMLFAFILYAIFTI